MRLDHLLSREICRRFAGGTSQVVLPGFQISALFFSLSGALESAIELGRHAGRARFVPPGFDQVGVPREPEASKASEGHVLSGLDLLRDATWACSSVG